MVNIYLLNDLKHFKDIGSYSLNSFNKRDFGHILLLLIKEAIMAVIIKYIVERKGIEKMTFTSKKDADAYDKLLDSADQLSDFLNESPLELDEGQREELGLFLATNKEIVQKLFKGAKFVPEQI